MQKKTYVLLKDLPNIPAGTEVTWNDTSTWVNGPLKGGRYGVWDMPSDRSQTQTWTCEDVENNPSWFKPKEEPKPDWEILHCIGCGIVHEYNSEVCLGADPSVIVCEIFSIKRLSDGEILVAGKGNYGSVERTDGYPNKPIKKFLLKDGVMYAQFDEGRGCNDGCLGINSIRKNGEPLFTTKDGFDIYDSNTVIYWVRLEDFKFGKQPYVSSGLKEHTKFVYFKYESNAKNYCEENKVKEPLFVTEDGYDVTDPITWIYIVNKAFITWEANAASCTGDTNLKYFYILSNRTKYIEENELLPQCCICGGKTVFIRGKYPNTPKRNVCAQCNTERLEQIEEISSSNYGKTSRGN